MRKFFAFILLLLSGLLCLTWALQPSKNKTSKRTSSSGQIVLLHADSMFFNQRVNPNAQFFLGNVKFEHDGAIMTCDSALYYRDSKSFDAYGRVKMVQGDSLSLTCRVLYYKGMEKLAQARENVVLKHRGTTLTSESIDFDRILNVGQYFSGGKLIDEQNQLTSDTGYYHPDTRQAEFRHYVELVNPIPPKERDYILQTHLLYYNTATTLSHVVGPSTIDHESTHIYTENGYYTSKIEEAYLLGHTSLIQYVYKELVGDSMHYDGITHDSKAFGNVVYIDKENKNEFRGNYGLYNDSTGYAEAADSAVLIDYSRGNDTLFAHADTFKLFTYRDTLHIKDSLVVKSPEKALETAAGAQLAKLQDSVSVNLPVDSTLTAAVLPKDSAVMMPLAVTDSISAKPLVNSEKPATIPLPKKDDAATKPVVDNASAASGGSVAMRDSVYEYRVLHAYNRVRAYSDSLQCVCDSMVYSSKDSCATLYKDPIVWQAKQQILGEMIKTWDNGESLDSIHVINQSLLVEKLDTMNHYNQVASNLMYSYFRDGKVYQNVADQNVYVNYYPYDDDSLMIGMVHAESSRMRMDLDSGKVQRIWMPETVGEMFPLHLTPPEKIYLDNFKTKDGGVAWFDDIRPKSKYDIFVWQDKPEESQLKEIVSQKDPNSDMSADERMNEWLEKKRQHKRR